MDTIPYIISFCLIWQYSLYECTKQECNKAVLSHHVKPISLTVKIGERDLDLSWDCGFPQKIQKKVVYDIYMKNGERYHYKTKTEKCNMTIPLGTHPAVCLKVIPNIDKEECQQLSSEKCIMRERIGTAAENVSCRVFNTSSMTCTWTFGKNAPHTNSYILSLRQKTYIVQCQQYERHFQTKTGACTFHDLSVNFFDYATIFLQGSDPGIQSFEKTIRLSEIEVFSPPRNISITSFKDSITIYWESPQTQEYVSDLCFTYNIEKNKDSYNASSNPFTISNLEKECSIRIRARGIEECDMNTNWGEWSEWIDCGLLAMIKPPDPDQFKAQLIPVILVSCLISVILIITILQYKRIVNVCLPRVPEPKNYLQSTKDCKMNMENIDFSPNLSKSETEEFIVVKDNLL